MSNHRVRRVLAVLAASSLASACEVSSDHERRNHAASAGDHAAGHVGERPQPIGNVPKLGLMTSLPLYWPIGTDMAMLARGDAEIPWQRERLEEGHRLVMLDTLSPITGLTADAPETDPLDGLERLAVIQPRGLSPSDNVALDDWVRGGGRLLLVLDPALTGHYDAPFGDPRRPVDTAIIPPVVARWGLKVVFDEEQADARVVPLREGTLPVALAGEITELEGAGTDCLISSQGIVAQCAIGRGQITLIADATVFEHHPSAPHGHREGKDPPEGAGLGGETGITHVLSFAFSDY